MPSASSTASSSSSRSTVIFFFMGFRGCAQCKMHLGPLGAVGEPDAASVRFDDGSAEAETDPEACPLRRTEGHERSGELLCVEPRALVFYRELDAIAIAPMRCNDNRPSDARLF